MKTEKNMDTIIAEISEVLKQTVYDEPILALAGSHAKGYSDEHSDLDIFMFINSPKPFSEREQIIKDFCDHNTEFWITDNFDYPWGGSIDFTYEGISIEVVVRLMPHMDRIVEDCLNGKFEIIPQTWTSNGYYTYMYLSELDFIKPIYDRDNLLSQYKEKVKQYPLKLKQAIISEFMMRSRTWLDNFHYQSAILREDVFFVAPIVTHTIMDMIQVVFAINEKYFTGDKKLETVLKTLNYCPKLLIDNFELLFDFRKNKDILQKQFDILNELYYELCCYTK